MDSLYFSRNGISNQKLQQYIIAASGNITHPGLTWTEIAGVAEYVAYHWQQNNGSLADYETYKSVVEQKCEVLKSNKRLQLRIRKTQDALYNLT